MRSLLQDLRYGARILRRAPGFTMVAVLVLALGIGANTAVFTIVNALLLRPLNNGDTQAVVGLYSRDTARPDRYRGFSYPNYLDVRERSGLFTELAALDFSMVGLSENGVTRRVFVALVSSNYFSALGVGTARGRAFSREEERPGRAGNVAIVSYEYWRRTGFDAGILERTLRLNGRPFTIVGVTPEGFNGTTAIVTPEIWLPLGVHDDVMSAAFSEGPPRRLDDRSNHGLMVIGRLRPDITEAHATARLAALSTQLAQAYPAEDRDQALVLRSLSRLSLGTHPQDDSEEVVVSALLLAMSGVVLVIASMNLANMLLARGSMRRKEFAVRIAVGGSRMRVIRQLLTEGLLLSILGATAGLVLAFWATRLLVVSLAPIMPLLVTFDPRPDVRVLGATVAFAVASTIVASLGPAWRFSRPDLVPDLKAQGHEDRVRRGWRALASARHGLVVGQVALSLVLLTAGGLFLRGALQAAASDPGFRLERGLVLGLDPTLAGYDPARTATAYRDVLARVRSLAGVESASLASIVPFGEFTDMRDVEPAGAGPARRHEPVGAHYIVVGADYFAALGLPVLRGRGFTRAEEEEERGRGVRAVVIDEPLARRLWPDRDPVGQSLRFVTRDAAAAPQAPWEVVGVVPGVRHDLLDRVAPPHVYLSMGSDARPAMTLHVRVAQSGGAAAHRMIGTIRRELHAIDPAFPVLTARTFAEHRDASLMLWVVRTGATLFTTFGALALLLAAVGLYGVKSYLVSQRTREIGIRMALGAQSRDVLGMVLRDGARVTATGLGIGLALSAGVALLLRSMLYRVNPFDPVTFVAAPSVLALAAFVACWLPARRATRVVPVQALRNE